MKKEKTNRIKTNNQELLIRKQNESDATSWWIEKPGKGIAINILCVGV